MPNIYNDITMQKINTLYIYIQVNCVSEFDNSFTGSERIFVFIFIRHKVTFEKESRV